MNESFPRARSLTHIDSIAWVMKSFLLAFIPISIIFLLLLVVRGDDKCCVRMKEERVRNASAMRCISCADICERNARDINHTRAEEEE
jgi:hypothetical protein